MVLDSTGPSVRIRREPDGPRPDAGAERAGPVAAPAPREGSLREAAVRLRRIGHRTRVRAGALVADNGFLAMSLAGRLHPHARPERHGLHVVRDVAYAPGGAEHRLDIWLPAGAGPHPVVLYVHGGGFRKLSKETHWIMALLFARRGYLVFNVNYRLAPKHPYPAALQDVAAAWKWVAGHAQLWGGDPTRAVFAGESAGGNLATALAVAMSYRRPEPELREVFDRTPPPKALVAACGLLQASDGARFHRRRPLRTFIRDRVEEVTEAYLGEAQPWGDGGLEMADPLVVLERGRAPDRPLPPVFAFAGTADPLLDDTRRLGRALDRLGVTNRVRIYPNELHAFHAVVLRRVARGCWGETFAFLEDALAGRAP